MKNSDDSLKNLKLLIESNNSREIIVILHNLKSASQNMGALALTNYLLSFEHKLENRDCEVHEIDLEFLQRELNAIETTFNSFIDTNGLT